MPRCADVLQAAMPGHNGANLTRDIAASADRSKCRAFSGFFSWSARLTALVSGGLYILAVKFEPEVREVTKVVPGVKIRKQ